jgi:hypothetical protein
MTTLETGTVAPDTRATSTFQPEVLPMRTHILTVGLLLVVPLAAGCGRASADTPDTVPALPSAVIGVAGNCPADARPMHLSSASAIVDRNGDGYVCTRHVRSIAGDTLRVTVDNDVPAADSERIEPELYVGM